MKIGTKSRYFLELLAAFGGDALEGMFTISQFRRAILCSSDDNFRRRAKALRKAGFVRFDAENERSKWVATLSQTGDAIVNQNINPEVEWNTSWDGKWRLFAFDLPQGKTRERQALRLWMQQARLGKLQGSLWITPKSLKNWTEGLRERKIDPSSVVLFQGDFSGKSSRQDYVERAWDFQLINNRYSIYLDFLSKNAPQRLTADSFPNWFRKEVDLWRAATAIDPFLPRELWPQSNTLSYLGPRALEARQKLYERWKQIL